MSVPGRSLAQLRIAKAQALRDLVHARLAPPERDRLIADLDRIIATKPAAGTPQDDMLQAARQKAAQAADDREEKRKPYEADPLFMYLWRRRYGTREYRASALVRTLDRKVAHLIGFEEARVNYTLLMELPERLREHAERMTGEQASAGEGDALRALDAFERRPEIAALLAEARNHPDDAAARRVQEIDAELSRTENTLLS